MRVEMRPDPSRVPLAAAARDPATYSTKPTAWPSGSITRRKRSPPATGATPVMGGRSAPDAGPAAAAAPARASTRAARALTSPQPDHDPLGVADRLAQPGHGVVLVLLVLEAGQVRVVDVEQGAEDRA